MNIQIMALPALDGDCILIKYGEQRSRKNILIDGGRGPACLQKLKNEIKKISENNEFIDLLVVTHVDRDHLQGILSIFKDTKIDKEVFKRIWFNSGRILYKNFNNEISDDRDVNIEDISSAKISIAQGIKFESLIEELGISNDKLIKALDFYSIEGARITILSPDLLTLEKLNDNWQAEIQEKSSKISCDTYLEDNYSINQLIENKFIEDQAIPNKSSIAFLFEYMEKKVLLLGDSHPSVLIDSLKTLGYSEENKLIVDLVKVSHHGSKYNTSSELLQLIKCNNYLISTNGGNHGVPNKECLARIVASSNEKTYVYFNYTPRKKIFMRTDHENYDFECRFLNSNSYNYQLEV